MKTRTTLRDRCIDSQYAAGKRRQDMTIQPGPERGSLRRITAFDQEHACFQFQNGNDRQEQAAQRHAGRPCRHVLVGFASLRLAQLGNNVGIENEYQDSSAGR